MNRAILTCVDAVHAGHAAAVVDLMLLHVDACSLALLSAESAAAALFCVDHRCEKAELREEAKDCTYRADSVAPCSSVLPCEYGDDNECNR